MTNARTHDQDAQAHGKRRDAGPLLRLVHDAAPRIPAQDAVARQPDLCANELAAEMAELFAIALVRDLPTSALSNPHQPATVAPHQTVTLHDILCEMRSLPWFETAPAHASDAARHRRALRLNKDGQLTLRSLFRRGLNDNTLGATSLWQADRDGPAPDPLPVRPAVTARMSAWLTWCRHQSGAAMALPGQQAPRPLCTATELARDMRHLPPAHPFHVAALTALGQGVQVGAGLGAQWTPPRLMALLAEAEARATRAMLQATRDPAKMPRPAVTAARMTVWTARQEQGSDGAAPYRAAVEILAHHAPRLLDWMGAANRALHPSGQRFDTALFLPLLPAEEAGLPSDLTVHLGVAGAMSTVLKAVLDTGAPLPRVLGQTAERSPTLGQELDLVIANLCIARCLAAGFYPHENLADLAKGEAIGLQLLRETLEQDNTPATATLTGCDGQDLRLAAHSGAGPLGHVSLHDSLGRRPWPQPGGLTTAPSRLSAVV